MSPSSLSEISETRSRRKSPLVEGTRIPILPPRGRSSGSALTRNTSAPEKEFTTHFGNDATGAVGWATAIHSNLIRAFNTGLRVAMNNCLRSMALGTILAIGSTALADASTVQGRLSNGGAPLISVDDGLEWAANAGEMHQSWVCDRSDNICGLDDPKMLSKPAKIDYDALLKATPEMKKIAADKIDPNSSEGINLKSRAADRVREKADAVRSAQGYCSVWKTISHKDGRTIPDITDLVKAQL